MKEELKISLIVPVYNVETYIKECFDSIKCQTYTEGVECIFVDDCGTDGSEALVEQMIAEYHGNIQFRVVHHDCNKGLSAARNTGALSAKGEYIYFIDSDDYLFPDSLESFVSVMEKYPETDMVVGSAESEIPKRYLDLRKKTWLPEFTDNRKWLRQKMLQRGPLPMTAWNKMVRREFFLDGLFFKEGIVHEDELWNYLVQQKIRSAAFVKKITYHYRNNAGGLSKLPLETRLASFRIILDEVYQHLDEGESKVDELMFYIYLSSQRLKISYDKLAYKERFVGYQFMNLYAQYHPLCQKYPVTKLNGKYYRALRKLAKFGMRIFTRKR